MGFLRRLFGSADDAAPGGPEGAEQGPVDDSPGEPYREERHAVSVWVRLGDPSLQASREQMRVYALEDRLIAALDAAGVGVYDTNELANGYLMMRMLGPDADAIVAVVRPVLAGEAPPGSYLALRHGATGTSEERVEITG